MRGVAAEEQYAINAPSASTASSSSGMVAASSPDASPTTDGPIDRRAGHAPRRRAGRAVQTARLRASLRELGYSIPDERRGNNREP